MNYHPMLLHFTMYVVVVIHQQDITYYYHLSHKTFNFANYGYVTTTTKVVITNLILCTIIKLINR